MFKALLLVSFFVTINAFAFPEPCNCEVDAYNVGSSGASTTVTDYGMIGVYSSCGMCRMECQMRMSTLANSVCSAKNWNGPHTLFSKATQFGGIPCDPKPTQVVSCPMPPSANASCSAGTGGACATFSCNSPAACGQQPHVYDFVHVGGSNSWFLCPCHSSGGAGGMCVKGCLKDLITGTVNMSVCANFTESNCLSTDCPADLAVVNAATYVCPDPSATSGCGGSSSSSSNTSSIPIGTGTATITPTTTPSVSCGISSGVCEPIVDDVGCW